LESEEFIHAIQEGRQPLDKIDDALANLKIAEQAYPRPGV
jgi:hypothetical protein